MSATRYLKAKSPRLGTHKTGSTLNPGAALAERNRVTTGQCSLTGKISRTMQTKSAPHVSYAHRAFPNAQRSFCVCLQIGSSLFLSLCGVISEGFASWCCVCEICSVCVNYWIGIKRENDNSLVSCMRAIQEEADDSNPDH